MKKILVIRLSSIGDIVLTTPVIRCLKEQLPGVKLHYAVREEYRPILVNNPYIDWVHVFKGDMGPFTRELQEEGFDYIVDLHKNFRSLMIRRKLGVRGASFPKFNFRKWILVRFKVNRMPPVHVVDRYFEAVRKMGVSNDGRGLDYFIPPEDVVDSSTLPEPFRTGYVALVIGAKHITKKLPVDKLIAVVEKLETPVILVGGPEDRVDGDHIAEACGERVFNAAGKMSLNASASLLQKSGLVITHDTGMMHIAAALGKRVISIWGNTVPAFGMYPYMPGHEDRSVMIGLSGLSCRPCSKLGYDKCPKGHFRCMQDIDPSSVAQEAADLIKARG